MTTNLEQIAKQVSLLNRLIELLRMQDGKYTKTDLFSFRIGWLCFGADKFFFRAEGDGSIPYFNLDDAWDHPITQKAWSDELVKVAGELNAIKKDKGLFDFVLQGLYTIADVVEKGSYHSNGIEAILNKYGRSLSE